MSESRKKRRKRNSGQNRGIGRNALSLHTTKEGTNQFKNKQKNPPRTDIKSNWEVQQQRSKEETFIETGRWGGDRQLGWRGLMARWWLANWVVPLECR